MGKYLNYKLLKSALVVGVVVILLCALSIVIWNLQQNRWVDKSILTGLPCVPPCWQGITPGVTTSDEALAIISNSPYIEMESIERHGTTTTGGVTWHLRAPGRRIQPGLSWDSGIVDMIRMGLNFDLTVQEVLNKFGNPVVVSVEEGGQPEHWYWIIDLHYPNQGITFRAFTSEFINQVKPTTEVGVVLLFPIMDTEEMIKEIEQTLISPLPSNYFSNWNGYGDVAKLYGGGVQWP